MEGEMSSCYLDLDMLSVGDLKSIAVELGYVEHRIRKLQLRRTNMAFDESLLPIDDDSAVHYLMELLMNESSVSIYVEHEDNDNWVNTRNMADVEPEVDNDVDQGEGLEELDIDGDDPHFELNDDVVLSKIDDEDIIMVKENLSNEKAKRQKEIDLQKDVGCSEQAGVSGHGGVEVDELGDDVEDSNAIISPNVSEDDEI